MVKKVDVLMSVYKPDFSFLEKQLESIFSQVSVLVRIRIRDDSGESECLSEVRRFVENAFPENKNITIVGGDNLGPGLSFLELCYLPDLDGDYFAFCDQDDVWHEKKLIRAISCLESKSVGLYASTLMVSDESLNVIYTTEKPRKISYRNALTENVITGCTTVFDKDIMYLINLCRPSYVSMHDHWLYMLASAFGVIYFDERSYVKYRQHGGNVVGHIGMKYYVHKIFRFLRSVFSGKKRHSDQVINFYNCYSGILDDEYRDDTVRFIDGKSDLFVRIKNYFRYSRNGLIENFIFKVKYICGLY